MGMTTGMRRLLALAAVLAVVMVACGDDDAATTTTAAATTTTAAATTIAAETTTTEAPVIPMDFNGDGAVRIAVATSGPRDDGAYNEALVERVETFSADNGFEAPLIVDLIDQASARTQLENIADQAVDIVAIGSSSIAEGNEDLFATYDEIFWYCNCGSGFQDTPGLLRSTDSGAELNISGGYATGLLIQAAGGESAVFIGCCDLSFEVESFLAFEHGLQLVDPTFTATYVATGTFPFDFENAAGAAEALNAAVAEGADAVYPFLGGAHEAIVALANEADLIVMTAGRSNGCERDDIAYDLEIKFDGGDYLEWFFAEILAGTAVEGGARKFTVGVDPQVGAEFCNATPEQVEALAALNARIGAGEFDEKISEILSTAYGF